MSVENTKRIKALLAGGPRQQSLLGGSGLARPSNELLTQTDGVARMENTAVQSFSQETRGCFQNANSNNRYGNKQADQKGKAPEVSQLPSNIPNVPQFNEPLNPLLLTNYGLGYQQWRQHMTKLVTYQQYHLQNLYGTLAANALLNTTPNLDHPASVADKSTLPSTTNVALTGPQTAKPQWSKSIESTKNVWGSNASSNAKTPASASRKIIGNKGGSASIYQKGENRQNVAVSASLSSITGSKHPVLASSSCTQTTSMLQTTTTANAIQEHNTLPSKRSLANSMLFHPKMRAKTKMIALTSTKKKEPVVPATNTTLQQAEPPKPPTTIDFSKVTIPIGSLNDISQLMTSQSLKPLVKTQSLKTTMASHSVGDKSMPPEVASSGSLNPPKVSSQISKTSNNFQKHIKGQRLAQVIDKIGSTKKIPVLQNPSSPKKTRKMSKPLKKCQDTIEDAIDKTVAIAKALADCEITDATLPKRWSSNPHLADSFSGYDVIINPPRHKSSETYEKPMTTRNQRESKFYNPAARHDDAEGDTLKCVERAQKDLAPQAQTVGLTCKVTSETTASISTGVVTPVAPTSFPAAENAGIATKTQQPAVSTPQHTQTLPSPSLQSWFASRQTESLEMQVVGNYPSPITISKKSKAHEVTQKQHATKKIQSVIKHTSHDSTQEKHSNSQEIELEIEASKTPKIPLPSKSLASEYPVLSDSTLSEISAQDMTLISKQSRSSPDVVWNSSRGKCDSTYQQVGPKKSKQKLQSPSISVASNLAPLKPPPWYQQHVIAAPPTENSLVAIKPHGATCASSTPIEPLDYSMGTLKKVDERQKQREEEQGYALDLSLPRRQQEVMVGEGQVENNISSSVTIATSSTSQVSNMVPNMNMLETLCMAALSTLSAPTQNTERKSKVQSKRGRKRPKRLKRKKSGDFKAVTSHKPEARGPKAGNSEMSLRSNDSIAKDRFEIGSYLEVTRKATTEVDNKQRVNENLTNSKGDENQLIQPQDSCGGSTATKSKDPEQNDNVAEENQPPVQLSKNKSQQQETEEVDPKSLAGYVNRGGNIKNIEKKTDDDTIVIAKDKVPIKSTADLVVTVDDPKRHRDEERVFGDIEKLAQLVDKVDQTNSGHVRTTNSESKQSVAMSGGHLKFKPDYEAATNTTKVTEAPHNQRPNKLFDDTIKDQKKIDQGVQPSDLHDPQPCPPQGMCSVTPPVAPEFIEVSHHRSPKKLFEHTVKDQEKVSQRIQPSDPHDAKPSRTQKTYSNTSVTTSETAIKSGSYSSAQVTEAPHHQSPKKLFQDTVKNQNKIDQGIQPFVLRDPEPSKTQKMSSTASATPIETAIESGSYNSAQATEVPHQQCPKKLLEDTVENQNKIGQGIQPFVVRSPEPSRTQAMCSATSPETAVDGNDINRNKVFLAALKSPNSAAMSHDSDKPSEEYISVKETSSCVDDDKVGEGGKSAPNTISSQAFDEGLFSDASDPDLFSDDLLFSGDEHERISLKSKKKIVVERKINLKKYKEGQAEDKSSENPRTALVWKNIDSPKSLGVETRSSPIVPESLKKFTTMTPSGRAQFLGHLVQDGDGAQIQTPRFENNTGHYWHTAAPGFQKTEADHARGREIRNPTDFQNDIMETTKTPKSEKIIKGISTTDPEDVFNMVSRGSIPFDDIFQTPLKPSHKKLAQSDSNESRSSEHEIIVITPESLNSEKQSSSDVRKEDQVAENVADDDEDMTTGVSEVARDLSESNAKHDTEEPNTAQDTRDETKLNEVLGCNPKLSSDWREQVADDSDGDVDVADAAVDDDEVAEPNHGVNLSKVAVLPNSETVVRDVVRVEKDNSVREVISKEKRGDVLGKRQVDLKDEKNGNQADMATQNTPVKMADSSYSVSKTEKAENAEKSSQKINKDLTEQHGVLTKGSMSMKSTPRQPSMAANATAGHGYDSEARKTFKTELKESTENSKGAEKREIQSKKVSKPRSPAKKNSKVLEKRKEKTPNKLSPTRIRTTPTKRPNVKSERSKFISPTGSGKRKTGYNIHTDLKGCDIKIKRRKLVKKDMTSPPPKVFKTSPQTRTPKHGLLSVSSDSSSDEAETFFKTDKIAKKTTTKFRSPPEVTPPPKVLQTSPDAITSVVPHDDVSSDSSDSSDEDEAFCRTDKMAKKFITMAGLPSEVTHDSNHEKENALKSMKITFPSKDPTTPKAILGTKQNITSSSTTLLPNVSKSTESNSLYMNSPLIKRCSVRLDHPIQSPSGIFQSPDPKIQVASKDTAFIPSLKRKNISSEDAISSKTSKNSLKYSTEYQSSVPSDVEPTTSSDSTEDEDSAHSTSTSTDSTTSDTSTRARPTINLKAFVRKAYSSSKECSRGAIVASAPGTGKIPKAPASNTKRKHGRWPFTAPFEARSQLVKPHISDTTPSQTKSANSPLKPRNETDGIKPHRPVKLKFQVQEHKIPGRFGSLHNVWRKSDIKTLATAPTTLPYLRESQTTEDESLKDIVDDIIQMSPPKKLKKSIIKPKSSRSQEKKFTNMHRTPSSLSKKKKALRFEKEPKSCIRKKKSFGSPTKKSAYTHRSTPSVPKKKKSPRMETDPKSSILTQKSLRSPGKKSTDTHRSKPSLPKKKKKASKMEIDPTSPVTTPNPPRSPAKKSIFNNRPTSSLPKNEETPRTEIVPNSSIIFPMSSGSEATKSSFTPTNYFTTSLPKTCTPRTETEPKSSIITPPKSSGIQARKSTSTNRFLKKKQTARIKGNWTTETFPDIGKISNVSLIHHQQSKGISKAERDENIYLTMQKLLNMGLIMDQMPRRGMSAPGWGDPMEFVNMNEEESYELPESPVSSEQIEEIPIHPNLKVEWYTSQQVQLKPCSVVLKRLEIKKSRVNLILI